MASEFFKRADLNSLAGEKFKVELDHLVPDISVDGRYMIYDFNGNGEEQYLTGEKIYPGRAIWNIKTLAGGVVDANLFTLVF